MTVLRWDVWIRYPDGHERMDGKPTRRRATAEARKRAVELWHPGVVCQVVSEWAV